MTDGVLKSSDPFGMGNRGDGPEATGRGEGGPASIKIVVGYGMWIFLLSDIIMFSAFFAGYAVLKTATNGGPAPNTIFDVEGVGIETVALLLSSFSCGVAAVAMEGRQMVATQAALCLTGLLGLVFLGLEIREFSHLAAVGAGPSRSAFLSAFFTLVGCHGCHIAAGLLWLGTMMAQFGSKGFTPQVRRRFMCFSLFWHALDIVWVGIFSLVYLMGVAT